MKTYRVYIGGNGYGVGNIGDDAILQGIVEILQSVVPDVEITIGISNLWGDRLEYLAPSHATVRYLKHDYEDNDRDIKRIAKAIRDCDCYISGGGTLIGDENGTGFPLTFNEQLISIAKFYGKPACMMAIGANNLRTDEGIRITRNIINLCDLITVRDEPSRDVCLGVGADPQRTFTTADPAFLLNGSGSRRSEQTKNYLRSKGKTFGVNVTNEQLAAQDDYKLCIARACDYLFWRYGYCPVFFCNEIRPGEFFDYEANKRTASMLACNHELLAPVYYHPTEMMDLISAFDFVISMRMHGLIFAALADVPFMAVSRVEKVDNFLKQFGFQSGVSIDNPDSDRLISDIEQVIRERDRFRQTVAAKIPHLRQNCLKNLDLVGDVLNNHSAYRRRITASSLSYIPAVSKPHRLIRYVFSGFERIAQILPGLRQILRRARKLLGAKDGVGPFLTL